MWVLKDVQKYEWLSYVYILMDNEFIVGSVLIVEMIVSDEIVCGWLSIYLKNCFMFFILILKGIFFNVLKFKVVMLLVEFLFLWFMQRILMLFM